MFRVRQCKRVAPAAAALSRSSVQDSGNAQPVTAFSSGAMYVTLQSHRGGQYRSLPRPHTLNLLGLKSCRQVSLPLSRLRQVFQLFVVLNGSAMLTYTARPHMLAGTKSLDDLIIKCHTRSLKPQTRPLSWLACIFDTSQRHPIMTSSRRAMLYYPRFAAPSQSVRGFKSPQMWFTL